MYACVCSLDRFFIYSYSFSVNWSSSPDIHIPSYSDYSMLHTPWRLALLISSAKRRIRRNLRGIFGLKLYLDISAMCSCVYCLSSPRPRGQLIRMTPSKHVWVDVVPGDRDPVMLAPRWKPYLARPTTSWSLISFRQVPSFIHCPVSIPGEYQPYLVHTYIHTD